MAGCTRTSTTTRGGRYGGLEVSLGFRLDVMGQTLASYDSGPLIQWETRILDAGGPLIPACTPKTCEDLGWECGKGDDGCGGTVDCGTCSDGKFCDSDHHCVESHPVGTTWVDPATGYEWQVTPSNNNGYGFNWQEAMDYYKGGEWLAPAHDQRTEDPDPGVCCHTDSG